MADQQANFSSRPNGPPNFPPYSTNPLVGPPGGLQNKSYPIQGSPQPQMFPPGGYPSNMTASSVGYNVTQNGHGTPPPNMTATGMPRMPPHSLMGPSNAQQNSPSNRTFAPPQSHLNGPMTRPSISSHPPGSVDNHPPGSIVNNMSPNVAAIPGSSQMTKIGHPPQKVNNVDTNLSSQPSFTPQSQFQRPPLQQRTETPPGGQDGAGDLPVPYHGQGQYSHQVGMSLTPGLTPNNSEPTSRKSSRAPTPIESQSYDALEGGDFKGQQQDGTFTGFNEQSQPTLSQTAVLNQSPSKPSVSPAWKPEISSQHNTPASGRTSFGHGQLTSGETQSPLQGSQFGTPGVLQNQYGGQHFLPGGTSNSIRPQQGSVGTPQQWTDGQSPRMGTSPLNTQPTSFTGSQPPRFGASTSLRGPRPPVGMSQPSYGNQPPPVMPSSVGGPAPTMVPSSLGGPIPMMTPSSSASGQIPLMPPGVAIGGPVPMIPSSSMAGGNIPMMPPSSSVGPSVMTSLPGPSQHRMPPPISAAGGPSHPQQPPKTIFPPSVQDMTSGRVGSSPSRPQYPQMPSTTAAQPWSAQSAPGSFAPGQPGQSTTFQPGQPYHQGNVPSGPPGGFQPGNYQSGMQPTSGPSGYPSPAQQNSMSQGGSLNSSFSAMSLQDRVVNLLNEKHLIPPEGLETVKPKLNNEYKKVNCQPDVFRCTLTAIPQTSNLLSKARLPLGILIHPFKDLSNLPVIQSSVIVRCRSCRTYINPFVFFVDSRRWKCNLCYRVNELPDEFSYDPVSKTYGEPQRRPEIKSSTIEFIAPSDYMLRPPQPAVYLFLLDVSFNAIETGYLNVFCQTMLEELEKMPGDSRAQIGFIAYDRALHFFNLAEGLSQPQMLIVSDVDDVFLPCPDDLLVNLQESKDLVIDLLNQLPTMFEGNLETGSALGAALQAAYKLVSPVGGRITIAQTVLPTVGPGALQSREDPSQRSTKNVSNLGPATDFYKKLALECSAQQVAVDIFMLNGQYADIATISCISKYSGGCVQYYPSFHSAKNPALTEKFEGDLRRYLTRKIGFEAVMRIRCTKGLSIHTFHGNFFVRSTDLLSLPNINPDAGFGMQMSIEDSLVETNTVCFQAALLYTSSKGERRIRVHTLCLPVTNQLSEIYAGADQQAIIGLLAKMAVDRSITASLSDARDALINAAIDSVASFGSTLPQSQRIGSLPIVHTLRLLPAFVLALLKSISYRTGINTPLDDRVFAMQQCKSLPVRQLLKTVYPDLYPVHSIDSYHTEKKGSLQIPKPPLLHLSSANIDRHGMYILDTLDTIYLYVGSAVPENFICDVLDQPNFMSIPDGMIDLPELENTSSELIRNFISNLMDSRPGGACFYVIRDDSKRRLEFFQHMVEDRTESSMSYYEFLQHIQKQVKS